MKVTPKLSLRREALAQLEAEELRGIAAGHSLDVGCLVSTLTWCGPICNLTEDCRT